MLPIIFRPRIPTEVLQILVKSAKKSMLTAALLARCHCKRRNRGALTHRGFAQCCTVPSRLLRFGRERYREQDGE